MPCGADTCGRAPERRQSGLPLMPMRGCAAGEVWAPSRSWVDARRRETCLDRSWCGWDSRGKASSHPRRGWDAKPPLDPGFLRLRQTRDGASQCCGPFSSYWSSSRWRYSSFAASAAAEPVGAAVAAVASRAALKHSPITQRPLMPLTGCTAELATIARGIRRAALGCASRSAASS